MLPTLRADWHLQKGAARTEVYLAAWRLGEDLLVWLYNENAHLGAVAVSQVDNTSGRVYTSLITLAGHKDDSVAQQAAYTICKAMRRSTSVIAGIHLDDITLQEIDEILANARGLTADFLQVVARTEDKP
ncbi:MAG: hypothetical protein HY670_03920 [Chloroflexi bacterium]|nr:hypothetical protein [Chloroflexota bacterium]